MREDNKLQMRIPRALHYKKSDTSVDLLIDVSRLVWRLLKGRLPTGIDRVCQVYLEHYGPRARALVRLGGSSFVFTHGVSSRLFKALRAAGSGSRIQIAGLLVRGIATGGFPRIPPGTVLLNPGHSGLESDSYPRLLQYRKMAAVFFVHDLIPLTYPEFCRPGEREKHLVRMKRVVVLGHAVITNSQATLDALSLFSTRWNIQLPRCSVALLGPGRTLPAGGKSPLTEPYFVMSGTIEPRKNHWFLLQVWRRLVERLRERAPRLVLIGQRGWECENVVDILERDETLRNFVVELSACPDQESANYIQHARALLFPSLAEGYGMPVLEALIQGVPVIASSLTVFREFARDIPDYIDPLDGLGWLETLIDFAMPDSALRAAQLSRLADFQPPSWSHHFDRVDQLLKYAKGRIGNAVTNRD